MKIREQQKEKRGNYKLVVFDLDGVLTDYVSSWMWVHQHFEVDNEKSYRLFREKKIDDYEFMKTDISLWLDKNPSLTRSEIQEILDQVPLIPGVKETFEELKKHGLKTAIVSGGIDLLAERVGSVLGADLIFANALDTEENGQLTGEGISIVPLRRKDKILEKIQNDLGITKEETVAVGDSLIDIPLFQQSGLAIAFDSKNDELLDYADIHVEKKDLREILHYIL